MKAYKGFFKDKDGRIYCQPKIYSNKFYYEEGKTYELPKGEEPKLCHYGFHACTFPMDVFTYYNTKHGNVEYHEVELEVMPNFTKSTVWDSKIVGRKITIGRKLSPEEMLDISINMLLNDNKLPTHEFSSQLIMNHNAEYNMLNSDGAILSKIWSSMPIYFNGETAAVRHDNKENFIDLKGNLVSEEWFDICRSFNNSLGLVMRNGECNFINNKGKLLSETWFDSFRWIPALMTYALNKGGEEYVFDESQGGFKKLFGSK